MALNFLISVIGLGIVALIAIGFSLMIRKTNPDRKLKKFLILTGASIAGFFASAILHNVISGVLSQLLKKEIEEPVFFLLATIACPIGLIVGVIGSIVQLTKKT